MRAGKYARILLLVTLVALAGFMLGTMLSTAFYGVHPAESAEVTEAIGTITVWGAAGLFADQGLQLSPPFESKDECIAAVEYARSLSETVAMSQCYEIKLLPLKKEVESK